MYSFTALALVTQLLVLNTNAQNNTGNSAKSCSDLNFTVRYNSSTTRTLQALKLNGERPADPTGPDRFFLLNDTSRAWELTLRVQSVIRGDIHPDTEQRGDYRQRLFLDTGDSNMTNIGSCHQTLSSGSKISQFQWTREALKRSLEAENGDCTGILGDECVQAVKRKALIEVAEGPIRTGSCGEMDNSLPPECSALGPKLLNNRQMNLTYLDGISQGNLNSEFDRSLECDGTNVSSTHSVSMAELLSYNNAVRFPTIDIVTFWPNRTSAVGNGSENGVYVELVCMRPDSNIAAGSVTPPSGSELLNSNNAKFPYGNGASSLKFGVLGWMTAAIMGIMLVL